jgi:hypothetical protein
MYCQYSGAITSEINGFKYTPGIEKYAQVEFNKLLDTLKRSNTSSGKLTYSNGYYTGMVVYDNGIAILRASDGVKTACFYTHVDYRGDKSFVEAFGNCGRQAIEAANMNKMFTGV